MSKQRYDVMEIKGFGNTRVFVVHDTAPACWQEERVSVWTDKTGARPACTGCSSPLKGMSGSCKHVRAVQRFFQRKLEAQP